MDIAVRGRHLDIPAELREAALEKAAHLERFLEGTQRAEILFSRDHAARDDGYVSCEVVVVARGRFVRARASGHLATVALEAAINKEAHRLTRMKDRLVQRSRPRHGTVGRRSTETPG
jgi:ribosomal subunit interface protein